MWLAVEWVGLIVKWVEFDGAKNIFAFLNFSTPRPHPVHTAEERVVLEALHSTPA